MRGAYSNKDGTFTYEFQGGKVEINAKVMGSEMQRVGACEFADGKLKVWDPSNPNEKAVLSVDSEGRFDAGMLAGKVWPTSSWKS